MDKNEEIIKLLKEYNQEHIIELLNKLNEIYPTINTLTNNKINIILFFFTLILHV